MQEKSMENIKKYWDDQARKFGSAANATTQDVYMRQIEINYISEFLSSFKKPLRVLDIGCGNGFSTMEYKSRVPWHSYVGGDYSEDMIFIANNELEKHQTSGDIQFKVMDVMNLSKYGDTYDVIISDRCLINLGNLNNRKQALWEISKCLQSGSWYLMIENFLEGHIEMNKMREYLDLDEIPVRWHNSFFSYKELEDSIKHIFKISSFENISSLYYLVTRVVYSKLCEIQKRTPDYDNPIYKVAAKLPPAGNFGPIFACKLLRG
ncbi:methyltransferase [Desulfocucumis palustris]|uniref:Methyltransferase n=1 Tax=Desulfocucumis palustris TaxID=1898651 RepID=A0A2L2X8G6_9FIRM|nr:class I SAM-dependent methyltransferase [Desulfocucumis palustris]GBF32292.1 methyltransferase [Desulfocucumis palustris]